MKKLFLKVLYSYFLQYLPRHYRPGGRIARKLRAWWAKHYLQYVGDNVNIDRCAEVNCDVSIGDNSGIGAYSLVMGGVTIGKNVMMGPHCTIYTNNHKHEWNGIPFIQQGYTERMPVTIGDNVWIGGGVYYSPRQKNWQQCRDWCRRGCYKRRPG